MKKLILVVVLALLLTGCTKDVTKFENAVADGDINSRLQYCLYLIHEDRADFYTIQELETLIDDIYFIKKRNKTEEEICKLYIKSCEDYILAIKTGDMEYTYKGLEKFVEAQDEYDKYIFREY